MAKVKKIDPNRFCIDDVIDIIYAKLKKKSKNDKKNNKKKSKKKHNNKK